MTAVAPSDVVDGRRDRRQDGGCVLEVPSGQTVVSGLSMPHSPRVDRGRLWLLNSGTGFLDSIDPTSRTFVPLTFCPGYLRGLAVVGDYAVVGLSRPWYDKTFSGLALDEQLAARGVEARCGLHVIDLRSGDVAHWLRVEGMVSELYDVVVLPGVVRPMALGFKTDEIQHDRPGRGGGTVRGYAFSGAASDSMIFGLPMRRTGSPPSGGINWNRTHRGKC